MKSTLSGAAFVGAHSLPSSDVAALSVAVPVASRLPDMATTEMLGRLPALDDDADIGVEKEYIVQRDGAADLKFVGTLLASAAPNNDGQGRWREYRVYHTVGGSYVFSKIGRSVLADERDRFEADMWAKEGVVTRSSETILGPVTHTSTAKTLTHALTNFFKFDPLAKQLYAKLNIDTTERID
jgi:hypothetical protein